MRLLLLIKQVDHMCLDTLNKSCAGSLTVEVNLRYFIDGIVSTIIRGCTVVFDKKE